MPGTPVTELPPSPSAEHTMAGAAPPELPPSPPNEQLVQRSLRDTGNGQFPASSYIPGVETHMGQSQESFQHLQPTVEMYSSPPPAFYQQDVPRSYPTHMATPGQEVSTPSSNSIDCGSSPSWTSSPHSPRRRRQPARKRATPSSRGRQVRTRKSPSASVPLNAPFSQTTAHMEDIPLKDMHAHAHRPAPERIAAAKKRGKIARPMNAFMMYRSAYSERAKALLKMKNNQEVNKYLAKSWGIELDEVREFYAEMADIERLNHLRTHPEYKFKPKKCPVVATRAEPMTPNTLSTGGALDYSSPNSPWGNIDFGSPPPKYNQGRAPSMEFGELHISRSNSNTPFQHPTLAANGFTSWASFPSASTIQPYVLQGGMVSQGEDMRGFKCESSLAEELHYGVPSGLNGIPGEAHHDLMQPQQVHPSGLDPQMLGYSEPTSISMGMAPTFAPMPNPFPTWPDAATHGFLTAPLPSGASTPVSYHGSMSVTSFPPTIQRNPSWDPSHHSSTDLDDPWGEL